MLGSLYFLLTRDALGTRCIKRLVCLHDDHAISEAKSLGAILLEDEAGRVVWRAA